MPSLAAYALKGFTRIAIKRQLQDPQLLLRHLRRSFNIPQPWTRLPGTIRKDRFHHGALQGDRLRPTNQDRAILYLHGGGYVAGLTATYHNLCGYLAHHLNAEIYLPDYRLAPEHAYPAALEDAVSTYEMLLQRYRPEQITIAGDSAGGGLSLALLLWLRDHGRPLPHSAIAISPFADMTTEAGSRVRNNDSDDMLSLDMLHGGSDLYLQGADPKHPYASPVFGDFSGLPPLFISVSDHECLCDDAYTVAARAQQSQVPVTFVSRAHLPHVWPIFYPLLPEARQDVRRMVRFVLGQ